MIIMPVKKWLYECISFMLILNFFYEGIQKLAYAEVYDHWITHAPLIRTFGAVLQYAVPVIEIAIAFLLIISRYRRIALIMVIIIEIIFILWVISVYLFTGYVFWPYDALWNNPTWIQKMAYGLMLSWLAFVALLCAGKKVNEQNTFLRNTSAHVN
jgi:uncharacterized membrane protein YphA (DoxX/SURF4 family)